MTWVIVDNMQWCTPGHEFTDSGVNRYFDLFPLDYSTVISPTNLILLCLCHLSSCENSFIEISSTEQPSTMWESQQKSNNKSIEETITKHRKQIFFSFQLIITCQKLLLWKCWIKRLWITKLRTFITERRNNLWHLNISQTISVTIDSGAWIKKRKFLISVLHF